MRYRILRVEDFPAALAISSMLYLSTLANISTFYQKANKNSCAKLF